MTHEFAYEITDRLMHGAARRLLFRRLAWRFALFAALVAIALLTICPGGEADFLCGLFAGMLLVVALLLALAIVSHRQRAERFLRKLADRKARCVISDEGLTMENSAARSFVKWHVIEQLVRDPEAWLLFISRNQFFVLPAESLSADAGAFIEGRVAAAGGRLR